MQVDRCICHNISFSQIKRIADNRGIDNLDQLRKEQICSTGCKLCEPYIKQMLQTGEIRFQLNRQAR